MGARPIDNIYCGTSSWTDKTLLDAKTFYPPGARSAEARLRFYTDNFPLVEIDSAYYAIPSERNAHLWVERTPDDFVFNVKAFGFFTQHPIEKSRLPNEIKYFLKGERKQRLYPRDLPERARELVWELFASSIRPLDEAGKLGAVLFQFPYWFRKHREHVDWLRQIADRFPYRAAVEFRGGGWMDEDRQESTLEILEQLDMTYVAVDEPQGFKSSVPPVTAVTAPELAMVRFHGRNRDTWEGQGLSPAERFRYLYENDELREWVPPVRELAEQAKRVHVLMNNCYADYGVRNASDFVALLSEST